VTQLERTVIDAIESRAARHAADTEVTLSCLKSALNDLMVHQAALQVREAQLVRWLEAIRDGAVDLEMCRAMARAALRGDREPPNAR
jgi:hypothetical protein